MLRGPLTTFSVAVVPLVVAVPSAFARVTVHGENRVVFTPIEFVAVTAAFEGNAITRITGRGVDTLPLTACLFLVTVAAHAATAVRATCLARTIGRAGWIGWVAVVVRWCRPLFGFAHQVQGRTIKLQDLVVVTPQQDVGFAHTGKGNVSTALHLFDA